jgi:hypothetical protein
MMKWKAMRRVVVPFLIALSLAGCAGMHRQSSEARLDEPPTEENAQTPRGLQNAIEGLWGGWPPPLQ